MESVCRTLDSKCPQDYAGYMPLCRWRKLLEYTGFFGNCSRSARHNLTRGISMFMSRHRRMIGLLLLLPGACPQFAPGDPHHHG